MTNSNTHTVIARTNTWVAGLIFIVLLILKVNPGGKLDSDVENWSWWLVTLPLWGGVALFFGIAALLVLVGGSLVGLGKLIDKFSRKRANNLRARVEKMTPEERAAYYLKLREKRKAKGR